MLFSKSYHYFEAFPFYFCRDHFCPLLYMWLLKSPKEDMRFWSINSLRNVFPYRILHQIVTKDLGKKYKHECQNMHVLYRIQYLKGKNKSTLLLSEALLAFFSIKRKNTLFPFYTYHITTADAFYIYKVTLIAVSVFY